MKRLLAAACVAVAVVVPTSAAAAPGTITVGVVEDAANEQYGFDPSPVTINVGDTIVFTNTGTENHDFLSLDGEAFGSDPVPPGGTFSHTFAQPGKVLLACDLHARMETTITVRG